MNKKFVTFGVILAIIVIIIFGLIHIIKLNKYKNDISYCEKSEDCQCIYGCGCYNKYTEMKCISTKEGFECQEKGCQCIGNKCILFQISESEIDTENEAIEYAKRDSDIKEFAEGAGLWIPYNAYFDQELGVWQVVAYARNAKDLYYQISFYPNGTITFKGPIPV